MAQTSDDPGALPLLDPKEFWVTEGQRHVFFLPLGTELPR